MTRGTLVLITEGGVFNSTEFNGDMGHDSLGVEVVPALKDVTTLSEFKKMVEEFNAKYHKYDEKMVYDWEGTLKTSFMESSYFKKWSSDYLYIKNVTKEDIIASDYNGKSITFPANEVIVLNFGEKIASEVE